MGPLVARRLAQGSGRVRAVIGSTNSGDLALLTRSTMKLLHVPSHEFATVWWHRSRWGVALVVFLFATMSVPAAEEDDEGKEEEQLSKENAELARKYAAVIGWKGFFESSETGAVSWTGVTAYGAESVERTAHGQFTIERSKNWSGEDVRRGVLTWGGDDNSTIRGEQTITSDLQSSNWSFNGAGTESRRTAGGTLSMTGTEFTIWLPTKKRNTLAVTVHPGAAPAGKTLSITKTGRTVWDESRGDGTVIRRFAVRVPKTAYVVARVKITLNLASGPGYKEIDAVQLVSAER